MDVPSATIPFTSMGRVGFSVVLALRRAASRAAGILRLPGRQWRLAAAIAGISLYDRRKFSDAASRDRWRRKRSLVVVIAGLVQGADGIGRWNAFTALVGSADAALYTDSLGCNCSYAVAWCDAALAHGHRLRRNLASCSAVFSADLPKPSRCGGDGDSAVPGTPFAGFSWLVQ